MNKRGLLGTLIFIVIILVIGFFLFVKWYNTNLIITDNETTNECLVDSDCVPATCCHPNSCVAIANAPVCEGIFCSASCEPGTLDCGQGSCQCIKGKCEGIIENGKDE